MASLTPAPVETLALLCNAKLFVDESYPNLQRLAASVGEVCRRQEVCHGDTQSHSAWRGKD